MDEYIWSLWETVTLRRSPGNCFLACKRFCALFEENPLLAAIFCSFFLRFEQIFTSFFTKFSENWMEMFPRNWHSTNCNKNDSLEAMEICAPVIESHVADSLYSSSWLDHRFGVDEIRLNRSERNRINF